MDLSRTFDEVVRIARTADSADAAWGSLIGYLESLGGERLPRLAAVDIQRDVDEVRRQIHELAKGEPPPEGLDTVYFGLFDGEDDGGGEVLGYYIAGVKGFDPEDGDSLCTPAWWPEGRYLTSDALNAIKDAVRLAGEHGQTDLRELLGYAGQLGGGLLVSRFAVVGLFPGLRQVVGFDSGDFAEIAR
jgi:hypothetical protein